jgi:hypothetical protein
MLRTIVKNVLMLAVAATLLVGVNAGRKSDRSAD